MKFVAAILKRPRTPPTNNPTMDYQTADSEHVLKRSRPFGLSEEVLITSFLYFMYPTACSLSGFYILHFRWNPKLLFSVPKKIKKEKGKINLTSWS